MMSKSGLFMSCNDIDQIWVWEKPFVILCIDIGMSPGYVYVLSHHIWAITKLHNPTIVVRPVYMYHANIAWTRSRQIAVITILCDVAVAGVPNIGEEVDRFYGKLGWVHCEHQKKVQQHSHLHYSINVDQMAPLWLWVYDTPGFSIWGMTNNRPSDKGI